jgi:hypothetical protein
MSPNAAFYAENARATAELLTAKQGSSEARFSLIENQTVSKMILFAYGVRPDQVEGAPA